MNTNLANIKCVSVWWCLLELSNTQATFEAQFIKKLSDTENELEKSVGYKKASKSSLYHKRSEPEIWFSEADARIKKRQLY